MNDESVMFFLEGLIGDTHQKKILRLIAKNLEPEEIIDVLLKNEGVPDDRV